MGSWDKDPGSAPGWGEGVSGDPRSDEPLTAAERSRAVRAIAEELGLLEGLASAASSIKSGVAPTSVKRETAEGLLKKFPELYGDLVRVAMPYLVAALKQKRVEMRQILDTADAADAKDGGVG